LNSANSKRQKDPQPFAAKDWVTRHVQKGSAEVFDSETDYNDEFATQHMRYCPLVGSLENIRLHTEEVRLYCDICYGRRRGGRAAGHDGIRMELGETRRPAAIIATCVLSMKSKVRHSAFIEFIYESLFLWYYRLRQNGDWQSSGATSGVRIL
jgi:hypothetical protein